MKEDLAKWVRLAQEKVRFIVWSKEVHPRVKKWSLQNLFLKKVLMKLLLVSKHLLITQLYHNKRTTPLPHLFIIPITSTPFVSPTKHLMTVPAVTVCVHKIVYWLLMMIMIIKRLIKKVMEEIILRSKNKLVINVRMGLICQILVALLIWIKLSVKIIKN